MNVMALYRGLTEFLISTEIEPQRWFLLRKRRLHIASAESSYIINTELKVV
jgi:hypothetical protein